MLGFTNAKRTIAGVPDVIDPPLATFEEEVDSLKAEEAFAQHLVEQGRIKAQQTAEKFADLSREIDETILELLRDKAAADAGSARAAYLADSVNDPLILVREPDAGFVPQRHVTGPTITYTGSGQIDPADITLPDVEGRL